MLHCEVFPAGLPQELMVPTREPSRPHHQSLLQITRFILELNRQIFFFFLQWHWKVELKTKNRSGGVLK